MSCFETVLLIVSAILAICGGGAFFMCHTPWYFVILIMIIQFIAWFLWFNVLFLAVCFISSRFIDKNKEVTKPSMYFRWLCRSLINLIMFFSNASVKVEGKEKIPQGTRFLMVGNHLSNYDPFSLVQGIGEFPIVFVSKKENFDYHMIGRMIHAAGFMALDREDVRKGLVTINKAANYIKEDVTSVYIFPEGTRNRTDKPLVDFKNGAFKIATKAGCPIVVAALIDTEAVRKRAPFRHTTIRIKIVEVIPAEEVSKMRTNEISERVYKDIYDNIEHNK